MSWLDAFMLKEDVFMLTTNMDIKFDSVYAGIRESLNAGSNSLSANNMISLIVVRSLFFLNRFQGGELQLYCTWVSF